MRRELLWFGPLFALFGGMIEGSGAASPSAKQAGTPRSIEGATVGRKEPEGGQPMPAIAMRHYREPALPMRVESTGPGLVRLRMLSGPAGEVEVAEGARVPGSRLKVVRIERRVDHSKLNDGRPADVSVVDLTFKTAKKTSSPVGPRLVRFRCCSVRLFHGS